jgi:hypothetical protein
MLRNVGHHVERLSGVTGQRAHVIDELIVGDAVEPGGERQAALDVPIQLLVQLDEDVLGQVLDGLVRAVQPAAEEALWRLATPTALTKTRELLGRRDFVTRHPQSAARLLERAAQSGDDRFDPVLEQLSSLRFHFWSPALARVGAKARNLLQ